jgi:hypothetical protein
VLQRILDTRGLVQCMRMMTLASMNYMGESSGVAAEDSIVYWTGTWTGTKPESDRIANHIHGRRASSWKKSPNR